MNKNRLKYLQNSRDPDIISVITIQSKTDTSCFVTYKHKDGKITEKCFHSEKYIPQKVKDFMNSATTIAKSKLHSGDISIEYRGGKSK